MSRIGQGAWRLQQANNPDSSSRCILVTRGIGSFGHVPLECAGAICERLQEVSLNGVSSSGQQHSCRIVNLYRPGDNNDLVTSHVIPAMIRKFKEAKEQNLSSVTLWRDGSPTREFLYVEDAAEGIVLAAERYDKPEPVNLGSGQEISIKDLANLIRKLTGYQGAIIWDTTKPNGPPRRLLDVSRAEQEFGFRASSSLTGRMVAMIGAT